MQAKRLLILLLSGAVVGGCASAQFAGPARPVGPPRAARRDLEETFERALGRVAELRYDEAATALEPLIRAFEAADRPARAAEAAFWTGYCHEKRGRRPEARRLYSRVIAAFPGTPAARQARARRARMQPP